MDAGGEKQRQTLNQNLSPSCPQKSASLLHSSTCPLQATWVDGGLWLIHSGFSLSLLPSHALPLLQHGLSLGSSPSGYIHLLQHGVIRGLQCGYLFQWCGTPPLPLTLVFCRFSVFLPFLEYVFPEVAPAWPRGSAVSCSGSVGAGWNWPCPAQGSPHPLLTEAILQAPSANILTPALNPGCR